jgi:hypothetical protein
MAAIAVANKNMKQSQDQPPLRSGNKRGKK